MARKRRSPETDTELLEYVAPGDGAPVAAPVTPSLAQP